MKNKLTALIEKKYIAAILLLVVEIIWALSYIIIHVTMASGAMPPMSLAFFRFLLAWIVLSMIKTPDPKPHGRDLLSMWIMGFFGMTVCIGLQNYGLIFTTATNASILAGLIPAFTVLGAAIFFREKFGICNFFGLAVAFVGGTLIIWNGKANFDLNPLGDLLVILSCLAWSVYTLAGRNIYGRYPTVMISRINFLAGAVCCLPFLGYDIATGALNSFTSNDALVVLYIGIMVSALGFTIWVHCVRVLGMVYTSSLLYFQCVITMIIAHFTIKEPITLFLALCAAGVIVGVFVSNLKPRNNRDLHLN